MKALVLKFSDGSFLRSRFADDEAPPDRDRLVFAHAQRRGADVTCTAEATCDLSLVFGIADDCIDIDGGVVVIQTLEVAVRAALAATDEKTRQGFQAGFQHAGMTFSLSTNAQNSLAGVWALREAAGTFPVVWPSADNRSTISLASQAEFEVFFNAAFSAVRSNRDTGASTKALILAATTKAQVEAALATDTR